MKKVLSVFECLVLFFTVVNGLDYLTEQPSFLPSCIINAPEFTKCSTNSIQKLFTQIKYGIPGLKTLGSIDPFPVSKVKFKQDNNNVATIQAELTKIIVTGFGDTIVKQSKVSKKDYSWETKFLMPKLRIKGNYQMNGRILLVPLRGNGPFFLETENLGIVMHTKTRLYEKGGFTFYNVTNVRLHLTVTGLKSKFENLFSGNRELEDSTNTFFNENWQDFFEALRPVITETIEGVLLDVLQKVFHFIPANFFVSDIPTSKELYG